jgi:hypothetical protein
VAEEEKLVVVKAAVVGLEYEVMRRDIGSR